MCSRTPTPSRPAPRAYSLNATATYEWSDGTRSAAAGGSGAFQVLVPPAGAVDVAHLEWLAATNGYGPVLVDHSYWGTPLAIHGITYAHWLWTNAVASLTYYLGGNCTRFTADLGLDDSTRGTGTADYTISAGDGSSYDNADIAAPQLTCAA